LPDLVIADTPRASFGIDQERLDYELSSYTDVALLSDGRIAVLCRDRTVQIFAADGKHVATYGGRGEGPGQFQFARMTVLAGDTLLIYDSARRRATWVHPEAGMVRSQQFDVETPSALSTPIGSRTDGAVLVSDMQVFLGLRGAPTTEPTRTVAHVVAVRPDQPLDTLFGFSDLALVSRVPPHGPQDARITDNVRYGGEAHTVVQGDTVFLIPGGSRRLEVRTVNGTVVREVKLPITRTAVSAPDRAAFIEAETAPMRDGYLGDHAPPPDRDAALEYLRTALFADSFPAADDLFLDARGDALWVIHGRALNSAGWRASKLSLAGEVITTLEGDLPGSRPVGFMGDRVLLARVDDDGVTWFELRGMLPAH
jgi:hypothetical protein